MVAISVQTGTARRAALLLNRDDGHLTLTGEGRRPMVLRSDELEVVRFGLEVSY
jgi:hypothetical protein